ncbi:MAG TPA: type II toxin-antitoxin system antitoxin SocA domain-containing protein [Cyclobacteriaceae bacterium]|nr:type II toxin-antitoxin system antitoxin SocA domain-containing protein [Cyclobacteriaceae bacterium]
MENPLTISNYFIQKSLEDGGELTPMKMVKLIYISHGWYLALNDAEPLLPEAVVAWKYGPVVQTVYHAFKKYGSERITSIEFDANGQVLSIINEQTRLFLNKMWDVYKGYTGLQLSTLTHQPGTPWDIVWNQEGGKAKQNAVIPNNLIYDFYRKKANANTA